MKIAVAGATGRVGRHTVDALRERGHEVVPIARSTGVDVITGDGLDAALAGVERIIDASTGPSPQEQEATAFFATATKNLQDAGSRAGVGQIVVVSIIGIDPFSGGYYTAKQVHEKDMLAGQVPARIVRAAQFHEFVETLLEWGTQGEVAYLPNMRTQLVAARSVGEVLADVATEPGDAPQGGWPMVEVAGPREERLLDAAMLFATRTGRHVKIEAADDAGDPAIQLMEAGALLPGPRARLVGPPFEQWLDAPGSSFG
jgi:uncharacterized protein YbjT (DUF2867 family)